MSAPNVPSAPTGKAVSLALAQEKRVYDAHRDEWIASGLAGKFVVIKGDEVFDMFNTYEDALKQGLKKYGNVSFLIKQIQHMEEIFHFFHEVCVSCPA